MRLLLLFLTLGLAACQNTPRVLPAAPDLRAELVIKTDRNPPPGPVHACWASDVIPAIIETRTEQVLVRPEKRDGEGRVISAAVFRSITQQNMVQDRAEVWFRAPCPAEMTLEFVATIQRALKARGLYLVPLTGAFDAATRRAIRHYQEPLGLDSERLSLAAARSLGIIAGEF